MNNFSLESIKSKGRYSSFQNMCTDQSLVPCDLPEWSLLWVALQWHHIMILCHHWTHSRGGNDHYWQICTLLQLLYARKNPVSSQYMENIQISSKVVKWFVGYSPDQIYDGHQQKHSFHLLYFLQQWHEKLQLDELEQLHQQHWVAWRSCSG